MNLGDTETTPLGKSLTYNVPHFSFCCNGVILTYLKEQFWDVTKAFIKHLGILSRGTFIVAVSTMNLTCPYVLDAIISLHSAFQETQYFLWRSDG